MNRREEDGVVAIVVAICLVVLMGAVALTIDAGGLLYRRREMVNGADAAALAAAMECSKGNGLTKATAAANHQFEGDSPGAKATGYSLSSIVASPSCGGTAGHVTVTYASDQPLYFAPVLGLANHHTVTTEATASWGPGGPFPVAVNLGPPDAFKTCSINATPGTDCYYLFDNNQNGNGDFGFLNLAGWGAASDQSCNGGGGANLLSGEITGTVGYSQYVFAIPNYVCQISGLKGKDWNQAMASMVGQTRSFPINDSTKTTAKRWYIVGFAKMTIVSVDQNAKWCGGLAITAKSETCVRLTWVGGGVGIGATQLETVILCDLHYGTDLVKGTCLG
jgi:Flp pilus assembly protein TadG